MMMKLCAMAVFVVLCALAMKRENEHFATLLVIGAGVLIFSFVVLNTMDTFSFFSDVFTKTGAPASYFRIVLKCLGLSLIGQVAANVCVDSGYSSLASEVILGAKAGIVLAGLPLFEKVLEICIGLIKS